MDNEILRLDTTHLSRIGDGGFKYLANHRRRPPIAILQPDQGLFRFLAADQVHDKASLARGDPRIAMACFEKDFSF